MTKLDLRALNKLVKTPRTEITRYKGEYYVLHICRNDVPAPLFHSKSAQETADYIRLLNDDVLPPSPLAGLSRF